MPAAVSFARTLIVSAFLSLAPPKAGLMADEKAGSPGDAENSGEISLFDGEKVYQGPREWRISNLVGDYAVLTDVGHYGWVRDVIFTDDEVGAVLVQPDVRHRGGAGIGGD